jgi:hypothetical protein
MKPAKTGNANDLQFEEYVKAVQEFELKNCDVKATSHSSAVTLRWTEVIDRAKEK